MASRLKTIEGVHGRFMCICAWNYVVMCFMYFRKLTKCVLIVLSGVLGTSGSKGKGST